MMAERRFHPADEFASGSFDRPAAVHERAAALRGTTTREDERADLERRRAEIAQLEIEIEVDDELREDREERRRREQVELRFMGGSQRIVGYAYTWGAISRVLPRGAGNALAVPSFMERVSRGAFAESIAARTVEAWVEHDPGLRLARQSDSTLILEEDPVGLRVDILPPATSFGREVVERVKAGELRQMSFSFSTVREEWDRSSSVPLRTVLRASLTEVSLVANAAYHQESGAVDVASRSAVRIVRDFTDLEREEKLRRAELEHFGGVRG